MLDVVRAGFDAVALMGSYFQSDSECCLLSHFSEVVLLLDGDDTGRQATRHIVEMLKNLAKLRVGVVPEGRQPDSLRADEIRQLVREAVPIHGRRP